MESFKSTKGTKMQSKEKGVRMTYQQFIYWLTIKPRLKRLKRLLPCASIYPCGSRYVCNPPVLTTDVDFLVYSEEPIDFTLRSASFKETSIQDYFGIPDSGSLFNCWRRGVINLIVTKNAEFRDNWNIATHICKRFNVLSKLHRVEIYGVLRGDMDLDNAFCLDSMIHALLVTLTNEPYAKVARKTYMAKNDI